MSTDENQWHRRLNATSFAAEAKNIAESPGERYNKLLGTMTGAAIHSPDDNVSAHQRHWQWKELLMFIDLELFVVITAIIVLLVGGTVAFNSRKAKKYQEQQLQQQQQQQASEVAASHRRNVV